MGESSFAAYPCPLDRSSTIRASQVQTEHWMQPYGNEPLCVLRPCYTFATVTSCPFAGKAFKIALVGRQSLFNTTVFWACH